MYNNVQYIFVPICVLYSIQYSVQYSLELRVRNNLQEADGDCFLGKNGVQKVIFFMYGISFLWSTVSSTVNSAMESSLYSTVYSVVVITVQVNELTGQSFGCN